MRPGPDFGPSSAPWHVMYLSVGALSFGVLVGVWYEFPGLPERLELATLGVIVAMFTVTSLLHWYDVTGTNSGVWLPKRR